MEDRKTVWSAIKSYKFNSLLAKNFIFVFVLVTLPLLLVLGINYNKYNREINTRVMNMNGELLEKNVVVTDNIMASVLDLLDTMSQLEVVTDIVQMSETAKTYETKANLTVALLQERILLNNFLTATSIYSDKTDMLVTEKGYQKINEIRDKEKWYAIHKQRPMDDTVILVNQDNSIFLCGPIRNEEGERVGLMVLNVELQRIQNFLESQNVPRRGLFFITDISGQTMYCNDQDFFSWDAEAVREYESTIKGIKPGETKLLGGRDKRIVSVMDSIHKSWRYAFITEMPEYKEETQSLRDFLITSVLVGLIASSLATYIITYLTYRPMRKIISVIKNPQLHWSEKEASKEANEMLFITSNILADADDAKSITEELEGRVLALRQAQFRALQFQIDPHFLYNTLETIKWRAVEDMGLGNRTSKMLTKVARLYRLGLENDDVIVSVGEELNFLKLYIEIVRIRFGDSIQFHLDVDESLYDCKIIKMCLQPIVENAIHHGLRPKDYHGNITVSAYCEDDNLCISVTDDGQNTNPSALRELNERLKTGTGFEASKVGLRNVNERIKLIYGRKYGVSIDLTEPQAGEEEGHGANVRVVLHFPYRKNNGSEDKK